MKALFQFDGWLKIGETDESRRVPGDMICIKMGTFDVTLINTGETFKGMPIFVEREEFTKTYVETGTLAYAKTMLQWKLLSTPKEELSEDDLKIASILGGDLDMKRMVIEKLEGGTEP